MSLTEQTFTVGSKRLAVSYPVKPSALNRQFPRLDSQLGYKSISKKTPAPASPAEGETVSEAEVIGRAQSGDGAAFERLCQLHGRRAYALCLRMVRD
jgi:hypothetical protein